MIIPGNVATTGGVYSATVGDGATNPIVVTHNLGTLDVAVVIREISTGKLIDASPIATTLNAVSITFATIPTLNQYQVTVISGGGSPGPVSFQQVAAAATFHI